MWPVHRRINMPEYTAKDLTVTVAFNASLESEKGTDREGTEYPYRASVTYPSLKDAVEKAGRWTVWALQRRARKGLLPVGKLISVTGEGEYAKTLDDQIADMDETAAMELFLKLQAKLHAKVDEKPVEMSPEEEAALEELTKPEVVVPVEKAPGKKGAGKK
jgi:hypothetical protein